MFCKSCGKEFRDDSQFCWNCGVTIEKDEPKDEPKDGLKDETKDGLKDEPKDDMIDIPKKIKCKNCDIEVYEKADSCPHCGIRLRIVMAKNPGIAVAGNKNSKSINYSIISIPVPPDVMPPQIFITTPAAATYSEGSTVLANYSCTDETALKSCVGTVPKGIQINVTGVGNKTFTVNAEDMTGNKNSKSINYSIISIPVPPPPPPIGTPKTVTLNVKEDTYISTKSPSKNYGTANYLYGLSGNKIYMKFDTSGIPQNATVLNANMTISISYAEGAGTLDVYPATSAWSEKTLIGNTVVTKGNNFTKMVYQTCSNDCWHTDTGFEGVVQGWVNKSLTNNGIVAFASSGKTVEYNARETGYIAYLNVKYI